MASQDASDLLTLDLADLVSAAFIGRHRRRRPAGRAEVRPDIRAGWAPRDLRDPVPTDPGGHRGSREFCFSDGGGGVERMRMDLSAPPSSKPAIPRPTPAPPRAGPTDPTSRPTPSKTSWRGAPDMRRTRAIAVVVAFLAALLTVGVPQQRPRARFRSSRTARTRPRNPAAATPWPTPPTRSSTPTTGMPACPGKPTISAAFVRSKGMGATLDTTIGKFLLGAAAWQTAVANGLDNTVPAPTGTWVPWTGSSPPSPARCGPRSGSPGALSPSSASARCCSGCR